MKTSINLTFAVLAACALTGCDEPETSDLDERMVDVTPIVDGVAYEPEDMVDLAHEPLHFYLDADAVEEGVIYAFTDAADADAFIAEREPNIIAQEAEQLRFRAPLNNSKFYDLSYYNDFFGKLGKGDSIANLGSHPDYNDNDITSVRCRANANTFLYDGISFTGASFHCRNVNIQHLNAYGWDNRASSLEVTP